MIKFKDISIKRKVMLLITAIIIGVVLLGSMVMSISFKPYYKSRINEDLLLIAEHYKALYKVDSNSPELYAYIDDIALRQNASILVFDENNRIVNNANTIKSNGRGHMKGISDQFEKSFLEHSLDDSGTHTFFTEEHNNLNMRLVSIMIRLDDQSVAVVYIPEDNINRSSKIAFQFFMIIGCVMILAGIGLSLLLSREITKPVIALNTITEDISNLSFHSKFTEERNDEIGQLGKSINKMSDNLERNLLELKEAHDQLQKDIDLKNKLDKNRKEFIANVSHELKTPLALMMGYSEALKTNVDKEMDRKYYSSIITSEVENMNLLIQELLGIVELDRDENELKLTIFDLSSLVDEVLDRYALEFKNRKLKIELMKEDIVNILADKKAVEKIITNYVNNALEYVEAEGDLIISIYEENGTTTFSVFNSGSQIAEKDLESIWDSFYKVEKNNRSTLGGTGIGLYTVKRIMEKHSGKFGVENLSDGVRFSVDFIR